MGTRSLVDTAVFGDQDSALDFIANVLESSTEYSIVAADIQGVIVLWNEGACRIYGFEPEEVVGRLHLRDLYSAPGREAGEPEATLETALTEGKWEGTVERVRSDGQTFMARVVVTPRRNHRGEALGFLLISKNISDEMRLTDELRDTQYYTRSLIESNIDALMTTDPLGIITDVNGQMEALTGQPRDELIGTAFKQYFTDSDRAEAGIKEVVQEGKVTNYELTARHKDDSETVVSYNASTFRDAEGRLQGVFAAARDITEQKSLEHQLRESEAYNRGLIEASVDGLVTVDPDGVVTDVNEQMCRMAGVARGDLIGTPFADHFADAERAVAGVKKTFDKGIVTDYVLRLAAANGQQLQVSFNASVFRGPTGDVRGIFASARDITEQAGLQRQLAEERAYNRGLIEASLDGLVTVDPMLSVTDVNETMCEMSGYSRDDLIGMPFPDYFTDPKRAAEGVRLTLDQGAVTNYELTMRTRDGAERLVSFNAGVFKDEEGDVRGIFASARDITDQAQLQKQLAEEQAYNRGLIEASVDDSLTITDVNDTMCRMVGRQRSQLIGSAFPSYFTEPERAEGGVRLTFTEGSVRDYVLTLLAADGSSVSVSFNAAVFRDSSGEVRGIFAAARNITSQKELEQQLRDSQFYTRSLIESNIDALMTTDSLGIITDVNEQMEALTGYTRNELIGTPFKQYFTDPDLAEDGIRTVLREEKVTDYELTARHKDGRETVVSYNAATFYDRDGKLQGVFAAARDVTERKRFEQQLWEKNVELEKASQAKDNFLASMSHELRTPLNAIIGFTGTLLMKLPGPLNEEQEGQLRRVQSSGRHLLSIINDLLDLAKIESGKVELNLEPFDCREVVEEVTESLRPLAEEKGLDLVVDRPGEPAVATSDRRALGQILINLVNNAIKFTETGRITVSVSEGGGGDGARTPVVLSVADTGPGIAKADHDRIFGAFERTEATHGPGHEGTGLGLHISQKLAELLGAEIAVESRPGKGATFTVALQG